MNIPEQIKLILWGQDKSQTWLAEEAGVTVSTVNSCINGRHDPRCSNAELMLNALGYELTVRPLKEER